VIATAVGLQRDCRCQYQPKQHRCGRNYADLGGVEEGLADPEAEQDK